MVLFDDNKHLFSLGSTLLSYICSLTIFFTSFFSFFLFAVAKFLFRPLFSCFKKKKKKEKTAKMQKCLKFLELVK